MKVVLFTQGFLPRGGGREVVVHYLAASLQKLGHDVLVLVPGGWWRHRHARFAYPVRRFPTARGRLGGAAQFAALAWTVQRFGADVVHAHNTNRCGYTAAKLNRLLPTPLVITPHGEDIHTVPEIGYGFMLDARERPKIEAAVRSADALTAISGSVEAALVEVSGGGVPVHRVANGIDLNRFRGAASATIRKRYGIPEDARLLLTVGHYHPRRGFEQLIEAMPKVLAGEPRAFLMVVGRRTETLADVVARAGVGERVALAGRIMDPGFGTLDECADDDLADLYRSAEVYISAGMSQGAEGLSLALLDGLAAGCCVVATRISGTQDVIRDEHNGLLTAPGDVDSLAGGLLRVMHESGLRERLVRQGVASAQPYDWLEIAREYVAVYERAIAHGGR